jgi:hypothetical protein
MSHRPLARARRAGRRLAATTALAAALAAGAVHAAPAGAITTFPDTDQISAFTSGSGMAGSVTWSSYRYGAGSVRVYNDMTDGVCTNFHHRIKVNGVWGPWTATEHVCTVPSYLFNVRASSPNANIQSWQFQIWEAGGGPSITDVNSPLGY